MIPVYPMIAADWCAMCMQAYARQFMTWQNAMVMAFLPPPPF